MAHGGAGIEAVDVREARRRARRALEEFEAGAEIGEAGGLGMSRGLLRPHAVGPEQHFVVDAGELRPLRQVDREAGRQDRGVEAILRLGRDDGDAVGGGDHVEPGLGKVDREAGMAVAAQHRFVRRRRRLREDVGIDLPAPAIIELAIALEEARKHRPFRLVDLR